MKKLMLYVSMLFAFAVAFAVPSFAQGFSQDNKPTPIFCDSGTQAIVTCSPAAGSVATAFSANRSRLGGELLNCSTNYLKCSFTGDTTTEIDAAYFLIYPAGDSYGRDRFPLKKDDNVYGGALYYTGLETNLSTKGGAKTSVWELQ